MDEVIALAQQFRKVAKKKELTELLSIFNYFPRGCCEHSSVLFGYYIDLYFPQLGVEIIRGKDIENGGYHFWLEINGKVFDLTIDQFEEADTPVYGLEQHPMSDIFCEDYRETLRTYTDYYKEKVIDIHQYYHSLIFVAKQLNPILKKYPLYVPAFPQI